MANFPVVNGPDDYPSNPVIGQAVFNNDSGIPEWWDGTTWSAGYGKVYMKPNVISEPYTFYSDAFERFFPGIGGISSTNIVVHILSPDRTKIITASHSRRVVTDYGWLMVGDIDLEAGTIDYIVGFEATELEYSASNCNFAYNPNAISTTPDAKVISVGAYGDKASGNFTAGSVIVFDFDDDFNLLYQQRVLSHLNVASSAYFGARPRISSDGLMLVASSYGYDTPLSNCGSVEVFKRNAIGEDFVYYGNVVQHIPTAAYKYSTNAYWGKYTSNALHVLPDNRIVVLSGTTSYDATYTKAIIATDNGDGTFTIDLLPEPNRDDMRAQYPDANISTSSWGKYRTNIIHDDANNMLYIQSMCFAFGVTSQGFLYGISLDDLTQINTYVINQPVGEKSTNDLFNGGGNFTQSVFNGKFLTTIKSSGITLNTQTVLHIADSNPDNIFGVPTDITASNNSVYTVGPYVVSSKSSIQEGSVYGIYIYDFSHLME